MMRRVSVIAVSLVIAAGMAVLAGDVLASTPANTIDASLAKVAVKRGTITGVTRTCIYGTQTCELYEDTFCNVTCFAIADVAALERRDGHILMTAAVDHNHFTFRARPGTYKMVLLERKLRQSGHRTGKPYGKPFRIGKLAQTITVTVTRGHTTHVVLTTTNPDVG